MDGRAKPDHDSNDAKADRHLAGGLGGMTVKAQRQSLSSSGSSRGSSHQQAPEPVVGWMVGPSPSMTATLEFSALLLFFSFILPSWQHGGATAPAAWQIPTWAGLVSVAAVAFIGLCRAKSDGQRVWRWGK